EVLAVGMDVAGQQGASDVLDRGLADRAGDADDAGAKRPAPGPRQRLHRRQRIIDGEDPGTVSIAAVLWSAIRTKGLPQLVADDRAPGPGGDCRRGELAAVAVGAAQAEEEVAGAAGAGVDRRPGRRAGHALDDDLGSHRRRYLLGAEVHAGLPSFRSSSRATSRSSKGTLRPPSNSCPCSWPLPAMTTVSPGWARPSARAIAARRSTST